MITPEWANVLVQVVYVIVSGGMLIAIKKQSNLTEKQGESSAAQFKEELADMNEARKQTEELIRQATAQAAALTVAAHAADESAKTAKDTVAAMIKAMRLEQRAWVSVGKPEHPGLHTGVSRWVVTITAKNTGRTPAIKVQPVLDIAPQERGKEPVFNFPEPSGSRAVIFPNGEYSTCGVYNFTDAALQRVLSGEVSVWVYGKIVYQDIFSRNHWTKFCFVINALERTLTAHTQHNEIDDDNEG